MTTNDCTTTDATILDRHVALVDKWQRQNETGNETFTVAEYDELAVIFRHDARELAVILDCKSLDYPPADDADIDEDEANCPACYGTGIGAADGPCYECNGSGIDGGPWRSARYGYADDDDAEGAA